MAFPGLMDFVFFHLLLLILMPSPAESAAGGPSLPLAAPAAAG
jgi:hypothetical protein